MLASAISQYETATHNAYLNAGELFPGFEGGIPVFDYKPKGRSGWHYNAKSKKEAIVLHYTMGYLGGDLSTLTKNNFKVSVPFVIARNGTIYRLFDPDLWSYHLGLGTIGGNAPCSKRSIGIELSNMGPLDRSGNWMWSYVGTKYCQVGDAQYYTTLATPYRGKEYYCSFPDQQIAALKSLLRVLCNRFVIPANLIAVASRYNAFANAAAGRNHVGICSHVNYRATGKSDIGPAFPWGAIP